MTHTQSEKNLMLKIITDIKNGKTFIDLGDYPTVNCGLIESLQKGAYITATVVGVKSNGFHDEPNRFRCALTIRGEVTAKLNSFENHPLWAREFVRIDCAPIMDSTLHDKWYGDSTWEDESWHNDVSPSFVSFDLIKGKAVKIWSENKNPEMREVDDEPQYLVHLYSLDSGDEKCTGEFIDVLLATDSREEVFNFILNKERDNEITRRNEEAKQNRIKSLAEKGKRLATFEDMQESRTFGANLVDQIPDLADPSAMDSAVVGFYYFDSYYILLTEKDGSYDVTLGNTWASFDALEPAERFLWDEFIKGEEIEVDADKEFILHYSQVVNYTKTITAKNLDEARKIGDSIPPQEFEMVEADSNGWDFANITELK